MYITLRASWLEKCSPRNDNQRTEINGSAASAVPAVSTARYSRFRLNPYIVASSVHAGVLNVHFSISRPVNSRSAVLKACLMRLIRHGWTRWSDAQRAAAARISHYQGLSRRPQSSRPLFSLLKPPLPPTISSWSILFRRRRTLHGSRASP